MNNFFVNFIKFDIKQIIYNKMSWFQIIYLQIFTIVYSVMRFKPELMEEYPIFSTNFFLFNGLVVMTLANYLVFDFSFVKFKQKKIIQNFLCVPQRFGHIILSKAVSCFLFNFISLIIQYIFFMVVLNYYYFELNLLYIIIFNVLFNFSYLLILTLLSIYTRSGIFFNTFIFIFTIIFWGIASITNYRYNIDFNIINKISIGLFVFILFELLFFNKKFNTEKILSKC